MSPVFYENADVDRYVGSCLITLSEKNNGRKFLNTYGRNQNVPFVGYSWLQHCVTERLNYMDLRDGWSGIPLISVASSPKNVKVRTSNLKQNGSEKYNNPGGNSVSHLSRMAIHALGSPLILSSSCKLTKDKHKYYPKKEGDCAENEEEKYPKPGGERGIEKKSSSTENMLPRVIKPRKRRKKERKNAQRVAVNEVPSVSVEGLSEVSPNVADELECISLPETSSPYSSENASPDCQCCYCDPSGLIWDIHQKCPFPFLTSPYENQISASVTDFSEIVKQIITSDSDERLAQNSVSLSDNSVAESDQVDITKTLQVSSEIVTSPNGHRDIEIKFFSCSISNPTDDKKSDA